MSNLARRRAEMPSATTTILDARSLSTAHRRLMEVLRPDASVLDVGCGTGAITRGIAEAVGHAGRTVGVDRNMPFVMKARVAHQEVPRLRFLVADAYALPFRAAFDVVTASRVLQWLADPLAALRSMSAAAKPGGRIVILDYNHEQIRWTPDPPASMRTFYERFLGWRTEAGLDNTIADRLSDLLRGAGLTDIRLTPQHETSRRGDPQFARTVGIWADVAASRGHQMVADGWITEVQRATAEQEYRDWVAGAAERQVLYLLAVEGRRPLG